MATKETYGVIGYVDKDGKLNLHYPITNADLVAYDNGASGLEAEDVQAAIDELAQRGGGGLILDRIYIDTPPSRTAYKAGEVFDPAGMIVKADYALGDVVVVKGKEVTDYAYPTTALAAGQRTVVISLTEGRITQSAEVEISVTKNAVPVPVFTQKLTYSGNVQTFVIDGEPSSAVATKSGQTSGLDAGTYTVHYTLNEPEAYEWEDGGFDGDVICTIGKAQGTLSVSPDTVTLNDEQTEATVTVETNSDGKIIAVPRDPSVATATVTGKTVKISAVSDSARVTLGSKAEGSVIQLMEDGTLVDFVVAKHDYESGMNGTGRTLVVRKTVCDDPRAWGDKNNAYAESAIDAFLNGEYKSKLAPDVQAAMGTTSFLYTVGNGSKTMTGLSRSVFLLSLAEFNLALSSSSYYNVEGEPLPVADALTPSSIFLASCWQRIYQWTRTPHYTGAESAYFISSDLSASTNTVTVRNYYRPAFTLPSDFDLGLASGPYNTGDTSVTVSADEGTNWTKPIDAEVSVDVAISSVPDFKDATWEQIGAIGAKGKGEQYWDIGDIHAVTVNGTVGTVDYNKQTMYLFIAHFNYRGQNGVYLMGFKDEFGINTIGLSTSKVGSSYYQGEKNFNMNHWGTSSDTYNYGGWKGCDLRYDILGSTNVAPSGYGKAKTTSCAGYDPSDYDIVSSPVKNTLMAALEVELRKNMKPFTVYTDNTGNQSTAAANVTASVDYIVLPAQYEVLGDYAKGPNTNEYNMQERLMYFELGNSTAPYYRKSDGKLSTSSPSYRSPYASNNTSFTRWYSPGSVVHGAAKNSYPLHPILRVA